MTDRSLELLHAIAGRDAAFRPGQHEAIDAVVAERRRVLLVQRTGWGKSAVYFIATRLLRYAGAGPTILVSPLLALMRSQIRMAERAGVFAARPARVARPGRALTRGLRRDLRAHGRRHHAGRLVPAHARGPIRATRSEVNPLPNIPGSASEFAEDLHRTSLSWSPRPPERTCGSD